MPTGSASWCYVAWRRPPGHGRLQQYRGLRSGVLLAIDLLREQLSRLPGAHDEHDTAADLTAISRTLNVIRLAANIYRTFPISCRQALA